MKGYLRVDGRIGIRNHLAVIYASEAARHVAEQITLRIPQAEAFGAAHADDREIIRLIMLTEHPNVGAVLLVGSSEQDTVFSRLLGELAASGKAVAVIRIQEDGGTVRSISKGIKAGLLLVREMEQKQMPPVSLADLTLGITWDTETGELPAGIEWAAKRITSRRGKIILEDYAEGNRAITRLLEAGANIIIMIIQAGSTAGSILAPVVKVCNNQEIFSRLNDDLDLFIDGQDQSPDAAVRSGSRLLEVLVEIAAGEPSRAEVLGHKEYYR